MSESTCAVPVMEGGVVLRGGCAVVLTTAVGREAAELEPPALLPVTRKRRVEPTSPAPRRYDCVVAPLTDEQLEPAVSQRCH
jgi:hypothetical protein